MIFDWNKNQIWQAFFDFWKAKLWKKIFEKEIFDVEEARRKYQLYWRFKFSQVYISYSLSEKSEIFDEIMKLVIFGQRNFEKNL